METKKSPGSKNKLKSKQKSESSPKVKAMVKTANSAKDRSKFEKPLRSNQVKFEKKRPNKNVKAAKKETSANGSNESNATKQVAIKRKNTANSDESLSKRPKLEEMTVKERRKQRKSAKANYEIATKAKQLWDMLRREDCPKAKRIELANDVYNLIKGKVDPLVFSHDTARVIECLMICGTEIIRNSLFEETKGMLQRLMKSKYAKFFVMKLLKYGTKEHRQHVMKAMHGKVVKLVQHTEASEVVEMAYNEYANVQQRQQLTVEFYGPKYALFKGEHHGSLAQILENEPLQKDNILTFMKQTLLALVEKTVTRHSIVHHVLLEYLMNCSIKEREEMIETIREKVVEILHTKDGSRVALQCIWHGTSKDRKMIIKSMRGHATKISMEENGYFVMLSIFDQVDDTKLVSKVLLEEMMEHGVELALHPFGRKVLLYLIVPRNTVHFHPDIIKILRKGEGNLASKKDPVVRRQELLSMVNEPMLKLVANNTEKLIECPGACLLVQTVLKNCSGNMLDVYTKIAELAARPLTVGESANCHIVESGAGHRLLKTLIKDDKERLQQKENILFSKVLLDVVPVETLQLWIECNRGSFILLTLIESEIIPVIRGIASILGPVMQTLKKKKFKGAELLYSKLKSLEQ